MKRIGIAVAAFAGMLGAAAVAAGCGASSIGGPADLDGATINSPDASGRETGAPSPRLLVVNALTEAQGAYDAVRVCFPGSGQPQPSSLVPLSNVAGIGRGGGADLGNALGGAQSLSLDVFDAKTVTSFVGNCTLLRDSFQGQYTSLQTALPTAGVSLVALVTDLAKPQHVGLRAFDLGFDDAFAPDRISAVAVNLSTTSGSITVTPGAGSPVSASDTKASGGFSMAFDPDAVVKIEYGGGSVQQTLKSIQYASEPTSTPSEFFGRRKVYLFALVGDPAVPYDASKPAQELTGRELRIVAIPYGD